MTTASSPKVLIVEDDVNIADLMRIHLTNSGYQVDISNNGLDGLEQAKKESYSLIILDIMLPQLDGMEFIKKIRALNILIPILVTTAKGDLVNKVLGFELGADDYLTKPFSIEELVVRAKALLRRANAVSDSDDKTKLLAIGDIKIDLYRRRASLETKDIELSPKLFDLLVFLISNPGRPFTRAELLANVWEYDHEGYEHTVDTHINRLRAKIEPEPAKPKYILTVWGVGYRFAEERETKG